MQEHHYLGALPRITEHRYLPSSSRVLYISRGRSHIGR
jgi:hypothetical protein